VTFEAQTYANASGDYDAFEITPADDKPVALHSLYLSNVGVAADAGDAQEEIVRVAVIRGFTSSGSGGAAPTPSPLGPIDTASGFTAETMNSTVATTGTSVVLHADGWNIRIPYAMVWTPETRPIATQANTTILVRLANTVTDDVTVSGTLYVEELA
jgi:hypothetical protein